MDVIGTFSLLKFFFFFTEREKLERNVVKKAEQLQSLTEQATDKKDKLENYVQAHEAVKDNLRYLKLKE
jgi:hypothetical protein